ncbi:unnamed protein product [Linum trigynum]|uniref:Secreted protein n=1 Tax=Linum trigynum TaxID=586398 RepID=A0AAV2CFG0_9ROSI
MMEILMITDFLLWWSGSGLGCIKVTRRSSADWRQGTPTTLFVKDVTTEVGFKGKEETSRWSNSDSSSAHWKSITTYETRR